jgi:diguanylate cyclase (GGDEF)-like protein
VTPSVPATATDQESRTAVDAGAGFDDGLTRPRFDAAIRLRLFIAILGVIAVALFLGPIRDLEPGLMPLSIAWPIAAVAFYLGEVNVVEVHFLRERHSFSLSELPGVMGLFLLAPVEYLAALIIGTGAALLMDRNQVGIKRAFNLAQFILLGEIALIVFHAIATPVGIPGPREWAAGFAAAMTTSVIGAMLVATAISLSGGAPQYTKLPEMVRFSGMVALANASLALLAVTVLWVDVRSILLLAVPIAIVFVAYRAYVAEREKHERLELLYESSRLLHDAPELDSAIGAVLDHLRKMFRAERVELLVFPDPGGPLALRSASDANRPTETMIETRITTDDRLRRRVAEGGGAFRDMPTAAWTGTLSVVREAIVGPMVGEQGLVGAVTVINRLGEGTRFGADDERLLETVANQVAVALENGQLEHSLHELLTLKEQLRHQAYHDPLTGLANRLAFVEQVDQRLLRPLDPARPCAVVFLDLDDFKVVNDTLGHATGDLLLLAVSERVRSELRSGDLLARLGGDEFAILPSADTTVADAMALASRVVSSLDLPFPLSGTEVVVGGSAGIAVARPGQPTDEILRDADVAMYRAKSDGKHRVEIFDPLVHRAIVERHAMTSDLARGISRGELHVEYQPIVHLATGHVVGVEALARWTHPTRGPVDPAEFVGLAEENGTILNLGRSILRMAASQVAEWQAVPGLDDLGLSVNLSPLQIQHPDFIEEMTTTLADTGLRPDTLTLEMTETAMFRDAQATIDKLEVLRARGIRIAIDDFGTGYSSLAYLRRFPVDSLKIARELIGRPADPSATSTPRATSDVTADDPDDPETWAFARAIVAMGRSLGLPVVAEGIETVSQLETLRRLQCELGQGYLFGRPAAPGLVIAQLRDRGRSRLSA